MTGDIVQCKRYETEHYLKRFQNKKNRGDEKWFREKYVLSARFQYWNAVRETSAGMADPISGRRKLAEKYGAMYYLPYKAIYAITIDMK